MSKSKSLGERLKKGASNLTKAKEISAESKIRSAPYDIILATESEGLAKNGRKELLLSEPVTHIAGNEVVVKEGSDKEMALADHYEYSCKTPNIVDAKASQTRMDLADAANCLALAMDAAESIKNPNALEKMLVHQMAVAHKLAMKLLTQASDMKFDGMRKIDMDFFNMILTQASKLMNNYQNGVVALAKSRRGGKQEVIVQHVHVSGDAKAIVGGKMNTGRGIDGGNRNE